MPKLKKDKSESRKEGRPLAFETVEELQEAVDNYFAVDAYVGEGDDRMYAPTMSGLALSCDVDRKTITNYANKDEFFPTIKRARAKIEVHLEQRLYGNSVTGVIFNLKNNFEWKDQTETKLSGNISHESKTDEELERDIIALQNSIP